MSALEELKADDVGVIRAVIEHVTPEVDGGRFPIKRAQGQQVIVEADAFADGHDALRCLLLYCKESDENWSEIEMKNLTNDRWRASFQVVDVGRYRYTLMAWVDHFLSWRREFALRIGADATANVGADDIVNALLIGKQLIADAIARTHGDDAEHLRALHEVLHSDVDLATKCALALSDTLLLLMARHPDRQHAREYERQLSVVVDPRIAAFGCWYEMFPRSASSVPGRHGTLEDCAARLPYIASMGFDVLYLPPLYPVGRINRKGRNNMLEADADDVGSVWAIGSDEGGHKSVAIELGGLDALRKLRAQARDLNIEIALDIAFQCAPDHPYVSQHPAWFRHRADGSIQFAENPPKKYQDIYPFDFENADWSELWAELKSIVEFWIDQGIMLFRVDNPHTKPFAFWEWLINSIKAKHPQVIFLSEAFTRPKVMHRLAKIGFSQSYTYFTWRNTKQELTEYFIELTQSDMREYFRPNCWPNTPDILPAYLQTGGRPAFVVRLVLASTLCSNYGIYGPAFELLENTPLAPGSEEYMDSEKYQLRHWVLGQQNSLRDFIAVINRIRRNNKALQEDWSLRFIPIDNDALLCYAKMTDDLSNIVIVVVNLDINNRQTGWVELDLASLRISSNQAYHLHDELSGISYQWHGPRNFVILDPTVVQAHIFQLRKTDV